MNTFIKILTKDYKKIINPIIFFSVFVLAFTSCSDDKGTDPVICTEEFVSYTVVVADNNNNFFNLDDFTIKGIESGTVYFSKAVDGDPAVKGHYVVMSDKYKSNIKGIFEAVTFDGELGTRDIKGEYVFTADECHISKVAGSDTVKLF